MLTSAKLYRWILFYVFIQCKQQDCGRHWITNPCVYLDNAEHFHYAECVRPTVMWYTYVGMCWQFLLSAILFGIWKDDKEKNEFVLLKKKNQQALQTQLVCYRQQISCCRCWHLGVFSILFFVFLSVTTSRNVYSKCFRLHYSSCEYLHNKWCWYYETISFSYWTRVKHTYRKKIYKDRKCKREQ